MYLLYLLYLWLLLQSCNATKCYQCKYFIEAKYQSNKNGVIQFIPEKCKLFLGLHINKQHIVQDNLETSICRKHNKYCGKDGRYFTSEK